MYTFGYTEARILSLQGEVVQQALFLPEITTGLIEILGVLALKDAGIDLGKKWERVQLSKVKKTEETLSTDDFKNL